MIDSDVLRFETANNPVDRKRAFAFRVLELAHYTISVDSAVTMRARAYERSRIKPLDAAHLASAVEARADFFCTTDLRLLRRAKTVNTLDTQVVTPLDLILALPP